jgi:hypothetical protein
MRKVQFRAEASSRTDAMLPWILTAAVIVVAVAAALAWKPMRRMARRREAERALRSFRTQREQLEARFFDMAASLGKPRGLHWRDCDWLEAVTFARDTESGLLTAFVAVNIRFEAVEGGDMEDVEAVGTVRDAAAVFHYRNGRWGTGGRALFNMNPADAVARLQGQYEPVSTAGGAGGTL